MQVAATLRADAVPALPGAEEVLAEGTASSLAPSNAAAASAAVRDAAAAAQHARWPLLLDPQTGAVSCFVETHHCSCRSLCTVKLGWEAAAKLQLWCARWRAAGGCAGRSGSSVSQGAAVVGISFHSHHWGGDGGRRCHTYCLIVLKGFSTVEQTNCWNNDSSFGEHTVCSLKTTISSRLASRCLVIHSRQMWCVSSV